MRKTLAEVVQYLSVHSTRPENMWGVLGTLSITQDDATTAYGLFGMQYMHFRRMTIILPIPDSSDVWRRSRLIYLPERDVLSTYDNSIQLFVSNQVKGGIQPFDTFQAGWASAMLTIGLPSSSENPEATQSNITLNVTYKGRTYEVGLEQKGPYLTGLGDALHTYPDFHQFGPYSEHSQLAQFTVSFWDYIDYSRHPHPHHPDSERYFMSRADEES